MAGENIQQKQFGPSSLAAEGALDTQRSKLPTMDECMDRLAGYCRRQFNIYTLGRPMKVVRTESPTKSKKYSPSKRPGTHQRIEHQIENGGCKCGLCQRLSLEKMRVVRDEVPLDMQLEKRDMQTGLTVEPYYLEYLSHFYSMDRGKRRIRLLLPEICVFEKGLPVYMLTKRKESLPLRMIKNKEKLNFYEVKNFFVEGFLYHNKLQQEPRIKCFSRSSVLQPKDREALRNECIAIARFTNNPGQILSFSMMDNLFKSNQRNYRSNLLYLQTLVGSSHYEEIRVRIDLKRMQSDPTYVRAKNEIRISNCQIKPNQPTFVGEREQAEYQDMLRRASHKRFLEYIGLKLILLHSFTSDKTLEQATIKFARGINSNDYYFIDLQAHRFCEREDIWGIQIIQRKIKVQLEPKGPPEEHGLQNKFRIMSDNHNTKNIERVMEQDFTRAKQHFVNKPHRNEYRLIRTEVSSNDVLNLENVAPDRHFRIVRNASRGKRPQSKFH